MLSQSVPVKLPNDYKSDKVTISLADKQRFNEHKYLSPLGQFITSCQQFTTRYAENHSSTKQPSFDIQQMIVSLNKIADEDKINRNGIKQLNQELKHLALKNKIETGKLSKLISKLEKVRDNPEQYEDSLQDQLNQEVNANHPQQNSKLKQQSRPEKSRGLE